MKWTILAVCVLTSSIALGQTTRPSTRPAVVVLPADDFDALKVEMERMIDEIAKLRAENKSLRLRLAVPEEPQEARAADIPAKVREALMDSTPHPEVGMTIAHWRTLKGGRLMGAYAEKSGSTREGDEYLFWYTVEPINIPNLAGGGNGGDVRFTVLMKDGKVTAWRFLPG